MTRARCSTSTRPTGAAKATTGATCSAASGSRTWHFAGNPLLGLDVAECNVRVPDGFDLYLPTDSGGRVRGAGAGGAWSVIPLWTGGDYAPVEARFTGMFSVRVLPGLHAEVSAPLEVRHG